jgi:hypothetical protein
MKFILAIIFAYIIFIFGTFVLALLFNGITYIAMLARHNLNPPIILFQLFNNIISPCFGSFLATYITPKIFKQNVETITTCFITINLTLGTIITFYMYSISSIHNILMMAAEMFAIFLGAKFGKDYYYENTLFS